MEKKANMEWVKTEMQSHEDSNTQLFNNVNNYNSSRSNKSY